MSQKAFPAANTRAKCLRRKPTLAEKKLWDVLRKIPEGRFRRQVPIGPYVFDFASHRHRLVIEVDGGIHRLPEVQVRDKKKSDFAALQGYRVLRVSNDIAMSGNFIFAKIADLLQTILIPRKGNTPAHTMCVGLNADAIRY